MNDVSRQEVPPEASRTRLVRAMFLACLLLNVVHFPDVGRRAGDPALDHLE